MKHPVFMALAFSIIMLIIFALYPGKTTFGIFAGSFATIFAALKYKLDQANYHKDLFEERYAIFLKINEIALSYHKDVDDGGSKITFLGMVDELDSIYRKSYFLFGRETYKFIEEFRKLAIHWYCMRNRRGVSGELLDQQAIVAEKFLEGLCEGQNLSKKFPELKIDSY